MELYFPVSVSEITTLFRFKKITIKNTVTHRTINFALAIISFGVLAPSGPHFVR
jgi:hypothetical protein